MISLNFCYKFWKKGKNMSRPHNKIWYFIFITQLHQNDVVFSPAFANILKEQLIVQQQTIPCKKALNLSFLMLKGHRSGTWYVRALSHYYFAKNWVGYCPPYSPASYNPDYRMRAIITRGLYTFYPLFEVHLCTVTFGLMYG